MGRAPEAIERAKACLAERGVLVTDEEPLLEEVKFFALLGDELGREKEEAEEKLEQVYWMKEIDPFLKTTQFEPTEMEFNISKTHPQQNESASQNDSIRTSAEDIDSSSNQGSQQGASHSNRESIS